jgi:hypothetical protein
MRESAATMREIRARTASIRLLAFRVRGTSLEKTA